METDVRERERDLEQRQGNFDAWMKEQEQIIQQRYNVHVYMYMQVGTCTLMSNKFGIQNMHVHSV